MPEPLTLTEVAALAAQLPPADQKKLAEGILQHLASVAPPVQTPRRRSWREVRGSVSYPLCGEDAQAWVSRSRQESDEQRESQWRGKR
jgi:hypothetical protein